MSLSLTAADLDADWVLFDNTQSVTLYILNPSTETFGSPQTVQALVPGESRQQESVEDGSVFNAMETLTLRASQVTGFPDRGSKIVDSFGRTWYVMSAEYKSWRTRIVCRVQNG